MALTYMPILQQVVDEGNLDKDQAVGDFLDVLGPIITFADPLSVTSISKLLQISAEDISQRLILLHSVLSVPESPTAPVRPYHLSFRDFLVDRKNYNEPFWVDEKQTHGLLASRCLHLLNEPGRLKQDICGQTSLGVQRSEVSDECIATAIPAETAYACRYWLHHTQHAGQSLVDNGLAHQFLQTHLLHWIEALSWLRSLSSIFSYMRTLKNCKNVSQYFVNPNV